MPSDPRTRTRTRAAAARKRTAAKAKPAAAAKSAPVQLADLAPADQKRLAADARAAIAETSTTAAGGADATDDRAEARRLKLLALIDDRDHLRGCPADGRVEAYPATIPANPDVARPEREVTPVRCIECGGATVLDETHAAVMARVDQEIEEEA